MASPMVDGRVEPHRKATYTLEIGDEMRREGSGFSGVKYNHKPSLASGTRTTKLALADNNTYNLSLRDANKSGDSDMFVFNGSRTAPARSYVLLFDQTTQKATLERLADTYTLNLTSKNGADVSATHAKIYPKKAHKDSVHDREEGEVDLFGPEAGDDADAGTRPDASNPYDFRHFLDAPKKKDSPDHRGYASSPDHRPHAAPSSKNTPRPAAAAPKKRKAASVFAASKPAAKPAPKNPAPSIAPERRAAPHTAPAKPTPANPGPKIKSAEFVVDSSDSDADAEGEMDSSAPSPAPAHAHAQTRRSPSPGTRISGSVSSDAEGSGDDDDDDDDDDDEGAGAYELDIEIPDAAPRRSNSPLSLASAPHSAFSTPRRGGPVADEIDFGDLDDGGGEAPARDGRKSVAAGAVDGDEDEEDALYMEMMEGLAGGDSSEESEEE